MRKTGCVNPNDKSICLLFGRTVCHRRNVLPIAKRCCERGRGLSRFLNKSVLPVRHLGKPDLCFLKTLIVLTFYVAVSASRDDPVASQRVGEQSVRHAERWRLRTGGSAASGPLMSLV